MRVWLGYPLEPELKTIFITGVIDNKQLHGIHVIDLEGFSTLHHKTQSNTRKETIIRGATIPSQERHKVHWDHLNG